MIQNFKLTYFLLFCAAVFGFAHDVSAQTVNDETVAVNNSNLTEINFPTGARRVRQQSVPAEIRDTLDRLIASGGDKIRQGGSEVVVWEGNYAKTKGAQMIQKLESNLKNSGWEYEIGAKENDFVLFSLFRAAPERRALVGFFVPNEDAFIFAVTEMVRRDAPKTERENQLEEETTETQTNSDNDSYETVKKVSVGSLSSIAGEWVSGSSGSMTTTTSGVYLGGNASRHTYRFSANGAVEYTGIMNVMTGGCRMQIFKTAKGRATLNGSTLTINWQPASFSRDDSCSPSKNYKKTLPAETETFQINFETYFDDKQLCLTSTDKMCFSKN